MSDDHHHNEGHPEKPPVFSCSAPDLRPLATLLSTVHFSSRVMIQISESAFHIETEIGKILQARAYVEKSAFNDWNFNPPRIQNSQKDITKLNKKYDSQATTGEGEENEEEEEEDGESEVKFEISMTSLMECMNIFGTATSQKTHRKNLFEQELDEESIGGKKFADNGRKLPTKSRKLPASAVRISYDGEGHPLVLVIEDSGVITRCALVTYEGDDIATMEFPIERQLVHLIMKSDWLKSAFSQFDDKSGSEITFMFSPTLPTIGRPLNPKTKKNRTNNNNNNHRRESSPEGYQSRNKRPTFRIEVDGEFGCSTIDFPNDKDILDNFQCKLPDGLDPLDLDRLGFIRNSYKLSHMLKIKKALDVSSKTSLRVDDTGLLSLQLLIPLDESTTMKRNCGYVEFMCVPIEDG